MIDFGFARPQNVASVRPDVGFDTASADCPDERPVVKDHHFSADLLRRRSTGLDYRCHGGTRTSFESPFHLNVYFASAQGTARNDVVRIRARHSQVTIIEINYRIEKRN